MLKLAEEIEAEMDTPDYVPNQAEALIVIAKYLKIIGEALEERPSHQRIELA